MAYIYSLADTWNDGATTFKGIALNVTDSASAAGSLLMDLQVGGVSRFQIGKDGSSRTYSTTYNVNTFFDVAASAGNVTLGFTSNTLGYHWRLVGDTTGSGGPAHFIFGAQGLLNWRSTNRADAGSNDLTLSRDAANTLAQRNGVNAQAFNLYNTYTDASNYERGFMRWTSNLLRIGTEGLGTGAARQILVQTFAFTDMQIRQENSFIILRAASAADSGLFLTSGGYLRWAVGGNAEGGSYDLGLKRSAAGVLAVTNGTTGTTGAIELGEMTAPAAPAANGVRIYSEDNGSGKTRLMALFATGAAQQIAIEP